MALLVFAFPILPGKKQKWQEMMAEFHGPANADLKAAREAFGLHERTFLQETPRGDMVIVTHEGDDVESAFRKMVTDPRMAKYMPLLAEVHGIDPSAPPPLPRLVFDSRG